VRVDANFVSNTATIAYDGTRLWGMMSKEFSPIAAPLLRRSVK
jgi:hypothetical protein